MSLCHTYSAALQLHQLLLADAKLAVTGVDSEPKMIKKAREIPMAQLMPL